MSLTTKEFLQASITAESGLFCLALGSPNGNGWWEEWYNWPEDIDTICQKALESASKYNVYFSTYLFSDRSSKKSNVLPSRTIQADLDEADISALSIEPTILVESSPGRHQAYWVLKTGLSIEQHELLSKKVTYSIHQCDRSGWSLGRKLRLPNTLNYKYLDGPKIVSVISAPLRQYTPSDLELLPEPDKIEEAHYDSGWIESNHELGQESPQEIIESLRSKLPPKVYMQYNIIAQDRSVALWSLMCSLFRIGVERDTVFYLSQKSANNKFADLKYHADRELAKDVLRAEQFVKSKSKDLRSQILEIRKLPGHSLDRKRHIMDVVLKTMKDNGEFIRTRDDLGWYVRRDLGRPIGITHRSEYLRTLLDLYFGLNSTETEHDYVVAGLVSYTKNLIATGITAALSYYDKSSNAMLLHSGKKDVYKITPDSILQTTNGSFGIVFPWAPSCDAFSPNLDEPIEKWHEFLFSDCLDNIVNMSKEEALVILRIWILFLLLRSIAISRPILALFGQPGAGKSTLFRRIYTLLYGIGRNLGAVTTPDDFDHAVSSDPLVVLDNVDTWEKWLPDRLALSAATSDITRRKLYTDIDTVVIKRQALVGLTAHNPKFGREDVADRLLLFTFKRLQYFVPEGDIINAIVLQRNKLWAGIMYDVQSILATDMPPFQEAPQFRVEDFSRIGLWIARALHIEDIFCSSIKNVAAGQRSFSLEEDQLLTSAVLKLIEKQNNHDWKTINSLWNELEICTSDTLGFNKKYHNAISLGRKLWSLQESLKDIVNIEWKFDPILGSRVWKLSKKVNEDARTT